jgi:hypothetical protein
MTVYVCGLRWRSLLSLREQKLLLHSGHVLLEQTALCRKYLLCLQMWVCDLYLFLSLARAHTHARTHAHINTLLEGRRISVSEIRVVDSDRLPCDTVLQECVVTCEDQGLDLICR